MTGYVVTMNDAQRQSFPTKEIAHLMAILVVSGLGNATSSEVAYNGGRQARYVRVAEGKIKILGCGERHLQWLKEKDWIPK